MFSPEMQVILGIALVALSIAVIWALWQRTARRSVTALLLSLGTLAVLVSSGPILWWQISSHLQSTMLQPKVLKEEASSVKEEKPAAPSKWDRLQSVVRELPWALGALNEAFYDYITVQDGERAALVLIFVLLHEESLREYQSAGGSPEELGLVGTPLPTPSVLVIVRALDETIFHVGELSFVQGSEEEARRVALRDLVLGEELTRPAPWARLQGHFPQFPNLLAPMRPGEQLIGLLRLPRQLDPTRSFQLYYGSQGATLKQNP
ncbi:MAG: hypothetical protein NZ610_04690 [Candidatus Bipolaricaulota bacterium]|nr:hypothetical protein [Candidatus Bipolaricaulota bacterium]MCS7274688.1 hypothetical protein [Candidatus Bipolaricaulota bacterium]MDW8111378.1 hypothetical protein [Candidatus Bipolaricaulota bacterium]MDW8329377.1 hypothetical protein [Candidatus Bipolaricaulota bacterium]